MPINGLINCKKMSVTKYLFFNFIRVKGYSTALIILLFASLLSLHVGEIFLKNHQENIRKSALAQQETINRYVKYENKEMGLLLYYLKFGLVNEVPPLAALSIGQRDINPSLLSVNIRNLEEQKYNTELHNPAFQLLGNMDFSFVLIYLFPLVIIAFCFNVISEEKESGIWKLICNQSKKPYRLVLQKLGIRFVVMLTLLLMILGIAQIYLQIPFTASWILFCIVSILYVLFWFTLSAWIITFKKNSNQNALILLAIWIILAVILPATANAIVTKSYPTNEAFEALIESRDGYHRKWDLEKEPTIEKFKKHYPQLSEFQHPKDKDFSWLWYFAMQQMGDDEAQKSVSQFKEKLQQRIAMSNNIGYFFPTVHTQLLFNSLSQSDLTNQLEFWEAIEHFHEQKRLYFYPKIFNESIVLQENWYGHQMQYFSARSNINWMSSILPLFSLILFFCILVFLKLRKAFNI
jgi:ABC-2 type transport system permease protein